MLIKRRGAEEGLTKGEPLLDVALFPFEPHSLRSGKGHKLEVKRSLCEALSKKIGRGDLERFKSELNGVLVEVRVEFHLWEGSPEVTNTRFKKDLDNLLKPVLDVLQPRLNAATKEELGLGLIDGDEYVCVIHASKNVVHSRDEEGLRIAIFKHEDADMLRALRTNTE